jgi:hypothetical protein
VVCFVFLLSFKTTVGTVLKPNRKIVDREKKPDAPDTYTLPPISRAQNGYCNKK